MTHCLSDEIVAAFVDGRLDDEQRRRVIEHAAACADCYSLTSAVWDYNAENPGAEVVRPRFGRRFAVAAASLATAAAVMVVFFGPVRDRRAMQSLVDASAELERRPVDGRLSGSFAYRAVKGTYRSVERDDLDTLPLEAAAAETLEKTRNPHVAGVAHLLLGEYDEAVNKLTIAANAKPRDVRILSDLATAYHARGKRMGSDADLAKARETAERAWSIEQTPLTAWNRALALDTREAWQQYLELDPASPWADEARERMQRLLP